MTEPHFHPPETFMGIPAGLPGPGCRVAITDVRRRMSVTWPHLCAHMIMETMVLLARQFGLLATS